MNDLLEASNTISNFINSLKYTNLEGEIYQNNVKNNHQYITLKKDGMNITCISWNKSYNVKNGQNIKLTGKFQLYKNTFSINFIIQNLLIIDNIGKEMTIYEQTKDKLVKLNMIGNIKKEINVFPFNIGFITSDSGSVIEDVKSIFTRNNFIGKIKLKNTTMQGINCSSSIIENIQYFNGMKKKVDLIAIFRGGGSNSDLEEFNHFELNKEIHNSEIVTLCAIGHATDTTQLINFVSDYSFGTPSMLAEFIIKLQKEYLDKINNIKINLNNKLELLNTSITKFNTINMEDKIKEFEKIEILNIYSKYKNILNTYMNKYMNSKTKLLNKISNIKPTILKNGREIDSVEDMLSGSKKMKICFFDGSVDVYYKFV
jgi:exodeoxyribonuclease VII large subunit